MEYLSFNKYLKDKFGQKVYKISLDGGFTCPNRDGKTGTRGCIFCSKGGSGDFAESREMSITEQIESGKKKVEKKIKSGKYIAYFQAFTNTYAPVEMLRQKYEEAINHPDIVALSIATRPDCLGDDVLKLLDEMNKIKPVFVELGLQTIHQKSAKYIRRGYDLSVYDKAVRDLKKIGVNVVVKVQAVAELHCGVIVFRHILNVVDIILRYFVFDEEGLSRVVRFSKIFDHSVYVGVIRLLYNLLFLLLTHKAVYGV